MQQEGSEPQAKKRKKVKQTFGLADVFEAIKNQNIAIAKLSEKAARSPIELGINQAATDWSKPADYDKKAEATQQHMLRPKPTGMQLNLARFRAEVGAHRSGEQWVKDAAFFLSMFDGSDDADLSDIVASLWTSVIRA